MKSCENDADLFTKNESKDIYNEHVGKFLGKVNEDMGKNLRDRKGIGVYPSYS